MPKHSVTGSSYMVRNGSGDPSSNNDASHAAAFVFDFYSLDWAPDVPEPLTSHIGAGHLWKGNGHIPDDRVDELHRQDPHLLIDGVRALVVARWPGDIFHGEGQGQVYIDMANYNGTGNSFFQGDEPKYILEWLLQGKLGGPFTDFKNLQWKPTREASIKIDPVNGVDPNTPMHVIMAEIGSNNSSPLNADFKITPVAMEGKLLHAATVAGDAWRGGDVTPPIQPSGEGEVSTDFIYNWSEVG